MNTPVAMNSNQKLFLMLLLGLTMLGALLASGTGTSIPLPNWVGGAMALGALFGVLAVFWRSGALRARFLMLFVAAFAAAALTGWLLS